MATADAATVLVVVVVVFNELDESDGERGVVGDGVLGDLLIDGFLPNPKRRPSQEVVVVVVVAGETEDSEGVVEEGDDDAAVVDFVVVAVADVGVLLVAVVVVDWVAKSIWPARPSSSSLQMEGERMFLGLSSD